MDRRTLVALRITLGAIRCWVIVQATLTNGFETIRDAIVQQKLNILFKNLELAMKAIRIKPKDNIYDFGYHSIYADNMVNALAGVAKEYSESGKEETKNLTLDRI